MLDPTVPNHGHDDVNPVLSSSEPICGKENAGQCTPPRASHREVPMCVLRPSKRKTSSHASMPSIQHPPESNGYDGIELARVMNLLKQRIQAENFMDTFGTLVGLRLRRVQDSQRIHAMKLVSDIMYEAELGNLDGNVRILKATEQMLNSDALAKK